MSERVRIDEDEGQHITHPCDSIKLMIAPRQKDLGGFSVRRLIPYVKQRMVGPWIFFDHMGPAEFSAGEQGINVRPHPHIGLATVTYLFEGEMIHRDSLGNKQAITPGAINLMVAGRGIVHSERMPATLEASAQRVHALQLWLALPESQQQMDPAFYHYAADDIPGTEIDGVILRVMMGSAYGLSSPVKTFADTLYVEAHIESGKCLLLPDAKERAVYVASGEIVINGTPIESYHMAVLQEGTNIKLSASKDSRIVIIGGEPMGPRHIDWNFVSTDAQLIEQAKQDWKAGRFPKVAGDEEDFIPLPE